MVLRNIAWGLGAETARIRSPPPSEWRGMSSREGRIVHLALRDQTDLRTESDGDGFNRCVVFYPADYKPRWE